MTSERIDNHAAFIWSVADLLRGDYRQSEYGRVMLPFTVLRRLDCVLDPIKEKMLAKYESIEGRVENFGPVLDAHGHRRPLEHLGIRSAEAPERSGQPRGQSAPPAQNLPRADPEPTRSRPGAGPEPARSLPGAGEATKAPTQCSFTSARVAL